MLSIRIVYIIKKPPIEVILRSACSQLYKGLYSIVVFKWALEHPLSILHQVIVNSIVQIWTLTHIVGNFVHHGNCINRNHAIVIEFKFHAGCIYTECTRKGFIVFASLIFQCFSSPVRLQPCDDFHHRLQLVWNTNATCWFQMSVRPVRHHRSSGTQRDISRRTQ